MEPEFDNMIRPMLNQNPQLRGQMNEIVHAQWFQDPLLKTIKYLEVLDSKDHQNKVQFL
jgi:serine/threonine protein kinase